MAEDKKKEKPAGWNLDPVETLIVLLLLVAVIAGIASVISGFFSPGRLASDGFSFYGLKLSSIARFFKSILPFLKAAGLGLAALAALGIFVLNKKADAISRAAKSKLYTKGIQTSLSQANKSSFFSPSDPSGISDRPGSSETSGSSNNLAAQESSGNRLAGRWEKIVKLSESESQSDWRLAIIEADIILDELLQKLQLPGETIGEKLKAVEKSDFTTIEYAWEAHKARNMIAHEGDNFLVNQREIRRIISLYEAVFKEFYLI